MKSFGVIWDHLESFKSWGYKIKYTKICNPLKKCAVLFWSVSTTDVPHSTSYVIFFKMGLDLFWNAIKTQHPFFQISPHKTLGPLKIFLRIQMHKKREWSFKKFPPPFCPCCKDNWSANIQSKKHHQFKKRIHQNGI